MGIGVALGGVVRRNTRRALTARMGAGMAKGVGLLAGAGVTGATAFGTKKLIDNNTPEASTGTRQATMGPQTSLNEEREDEVTLGSDRATRKRKSGSGRKSLMAPKSSGGSSGGLQV